MAVAQTLLISDVDNTLLGDDFDLERFRATHDEHGPRREDPMPAQDHVLPDLAHLELERRETVDDEATVRFQPEQDRPAELDAVRVSAHVRRGTDPVDPDPVRRCFIRIDDTLVDVEQVDGEALGVEGTDQWREPGRVFKQDVNGWQTRL